MHASASASEEASLSAALAQLQRVIHNGGSGQGAAGGGGAASEDDLAAAERDLLAGVLQVEGEEMLR